MLKKSAPEELLKEWKVKKLTVAARKYGSGERNDVLGFGLFFLHDGEILAVSAQRA